MSKPKLELVALKKEYDNGSVIAVDRIDLSIAAGETVALLGSSGCGKSTTLNMIVGIESPSSGDIQIDGKSVVSIPVGKRNVGLVFQDYAVFTTMTVRKNLAFGLSVRGESSYKIDKAVDEVAELLGMKDRLDTHTRELGGSELQRVAIGRTLVTRPRILLLDEPLSSLDAKLRIDLRAELKRLQRDLGHTFLMATPDFQEAIAVAGTIVMLRQGHIIQIAPPQEIYGNPADRGVAEFVGSPQINLARAEIVSNGRDKRIALAGALLELPTHFNLLSESAQKGFELGIRPENLQIEDTDNGDFKARVMDIESQGFKSVVTVTAGNQELRLTLSDAQVTGLFLGQEIGISVTNLSRLLAFDPESGRRIDGTNACSN